MLKVRSSVETFERALKAVAGRFWSVQIRFRREPLRYLFILGHMRCGSSLLLHLLASHPEILAVGESWIHYEGEAALRELLYFVHTRTRSPFVRETYVVDKVLHDRLLQTGDILRLPAVKTVFMVRDADRTLRSLHANRERLLGIPDWSGASEYYESRLERLAELAKRAGDPKRSAFVSYERLVRDPTTTLRGLTAFLGLRSPLGNHYRLHAATGVAGLGDFSEHIRKGRIVETPPPGDSAVPDPLVSRGRAAYERCVSALSPFVTSL